MNNHQEVISRLRERCKAYRLVRQAVMWRLYEVQGWTFQEVGNLYGLSRQRIHQVVSKCPPWGV